jgi:hypothetical protein
MIALEPSSGARMRAALGDANVTDAQVSVVVASLHEQRDRLEKLCGRSYFLFVGSAAAYSLLSTQAITAFETMGVTVTYNGATALLLPILAAYFVYRAAAAGTAAYMLYSAIHAYWRTRLTPFDREHITDLLPSPTPFATEAILAEATPQFMKQIPRLSSLAIGLALIAGPLMWFIAASAWIWRQSASLILRAGTFVAMWLLIARVALFGVQLIAMLYSEIRDTAQAEAPDAFTKIKEFEANVVERMQQASQAPPRDHDGKARG